MSLIALFEELKQNIVNVDLSKYTDDEIKKLNGDCTIAISYYNGMQTAVKLEANSVYGALANQHFRFYNTEVAGDVTTEGKLMLFEVDRLINQYYNRWADDKDIKVKLINKFGKELFKSLDVDGLPVIKNVTVDVCIYGDTDSRYVDYGQMITAAGFNYQNNAQVIDFIMFMDTYRLKHLIKIGTDKYISARNGEVGHLIMELEQIGGKGIFMAKKKYVMSLLMKDGKNIAKEGKLKATGVELIQGSSSKFVKDSQRFIINKLLTPKSDILQVFRCGNQLVSYAKQQQYEDLAKYNNVKTYNDYVDSVGDTIVWKKNKQIPAGVKASVAYNYLLHKNKLGAEFPQIQSGNRVHFYYTTDEMFPVFAWPDGENLPPFAPKMDYNKQIDLMIIRPLKRFVEGSEIDSKNFGTGVIQPTYKMITNRK